MFQAWPHYSLATTPPSPHVIASPRTGVGDITPSPLAGPKRNQDRLKDGLGD
ncbi:hypothetical protein HMPREF1978_01105 [Actinomyces graevenitzii F0530]|uniref:Uncharacterized protein n=1 Tax=Actinomyces graevenitzii F0530 TaxID=1321817 RepID=U1Q1C8_9ACTO|nr:hypothetical protein HMPREF1978_01105 [Actinomyces graevenitzii F0530]